MADVLETLTKLPPRCVATINGQNVLIERGVMGYVPTHLPAEVYETKPVTDEQRQAMIVGATLGWNHAESQLPQSGDFYTYNVPFVLQITIQAPTEEEAAKLTAELANKMQSRVAEMMDGIYQSFCIDDEIQLVETGSMD